MKSIQKKPILQVTIKKLPILQVSPNKVMNPRFIDVNKVASKSKALNKAKNI